MLQSIVSLMSSPSGALFLAIVFGNLLLIAVCAWLLFALRGSGKRNERWENIAAEALEREREALESAATWRKEAGC